MAMARTILAHMIVVAAAVSTCVLAVAGENTTLRPDHFSLNIIRKDSSPNHLLITWTMPEQLQFNESFEVKAYKKGSDSWIVGMCKSSASEYTIPDLMTNSQYRICVLVDLVSAVNSSDYEPVRHAECAEMSTPPAIRADSVLVLLAVIGYLLVMILLGYICWSCAHRGHPEVEEEESEAFEEKIENGDSRPFLLNAQPPGMQRPRPRSAIEDEDIPFITPTWDQLAREKKP